MALEQHSGFKCKEDIEIQDAAGNTLIKLGADGNIYIKGKILKIS